MTPTEIVEAIHKHERWVKSQAHGIRGMFQLLDLSGFSFAGCNLRGALFSGTVLNGADFSYADLTDADMFGANGRQRPGGFSYNIFLHEKGIK